MTTDKVKKLKRQIQEEENKNIKIAWAHLNWEWRIIFILGCISLFYICLQLSEYISKVISSLVF